MREKTFGYGVCIPGNRADKINLMESAKRYNRRNKVGRQHKGPLTRTTMDVLRALVWNFHNAVTGRCFPSYEAIAEKAECGRSTVHRAIQALEAAGFLTWCHRLGRIGEQVFRTSNGYRFSGMSGQSQNAAGTQIKELPKTLTVYEKTEYIVLDPKSPLEAALIGLGRASGYIKEA